MCRYEEGPQSAAALRQSISDALGKVTPPLSACAMRLVARHARIHQQEAACVGWWRGTHAE